MGDDANLPLKLRGVFALDRFTDAAQTKRLQRRFLLRVGPVGRFDLRDLDGHQEAFSSGAGASGGASSVATATGASLWASGASASPSAARCSPSPVPFSLVRPRTW